MDKAAGAGMTSQCDADAAEFSPSKLLGEAVTQTDTWKAAASLPEPGSGGCDGPRPHTHRSITEPHSSFAAWLSRDVGGAHNNQESELALTCLQLMGSALGTVILCIVR